MKRLFICLLSLASITLQAQKMKVNSASYALGTGNLADAKKNIDEAVNNAESATQAKTWMVKGDVYTAIYTMQQPINLFKDNPNALFEAESAYKKGYELELKKKGDYTPKFTDVKNFMVNEGANLFDKDKFQEAYKYLNASRELNLWMMQQGLDKNFDTIASLYTAFAAGNYGNKAAANAIYEELVYKYKVDNMEPYSQLLDVYIAEKNAKTEELLTLARNKFPEDKNIMISEINYFLAKGESDKIINKILDAIKVEPSNETFYFVLGTAYEATKDNANAKDAYKKAISLNGSYNDPYFNLGAMIYNEAIELNKKMNENIPIKEYNELKVKRDALYNEALPYFEKSYELEPNDRNTLTALKEIYARMNLLEKYDKLPK